MKERITFEVWDNPNRQFIVCRSENEAFTIADKMKGRVWYAIQEPGEKKVYNSTVSDAKK